MRRWRKRFEVGGIQGLHDGIRSGAPRRELIISDRERAELERFVQRFRINRNLSFPSRIFIALTSTIEFPNYQYKTRIRERRRSRKGRRYLPEIIPFTSTSTSTFTTRNWI